VIVDRFLVVVGCFGDLVMLVEFWWSLVGLGWFDDCGRVTNWPSIKGDNRALGELGVDALGQVWAGLVHPFEASSAEALKWTGLVLALKRAVQSWSKQTHNKCRAAQRWLVGWYPCCAL
jgi:hypothetical protein